MSNDQQPRPEDEGDDTEDRDVEETAPEAVADLLVPDPPHSPASEADAPPPG